MGYVDPGSTYFCSASVKKKINNPDILLNIMPEILGMQIIMLVYNECTVSGIKHFSSILIFTQQCLFTHLFTFFKSKHISFPQFSYIFLFRVNNSTVNIFNKIMFLYTWRSYMQTVFCRNIHHICMSIITYLFYMTFQKLD